MFRAEPSGGPSPRRRVAQAPWWRITVNNCVVGCQRHLAWRWAGRGQAGPAYTAESASWAWTEALSQRGRQKKRKREIVRENMQKKEILQKKNWWFSKGMKRVNNWGNWGKFSTLNFGCRTLRREESSAYFIPTHKEKQHQKLGLNTVKRQ